MPSLLLQSREDGIAPPAVGAYLRDHLPGSTLQPLDATGHCVHVSHPEQTIAAIRAYLGL